MLSEASKAKIEHLLQRYPNQRSALIPALHVIQDEFGYITSDGVRYLAQVFALSEADVEEVVTFYTMFFRKPVGKYLLQICTNISCLLCNAETILAHFKRKLGVDVGETTPDGKFTLLEVECIGACEAAPVMQVNFDYEGSLTKEKVDRLLEQLNNNNR